jgi:hypothetical protein
VYSGAKPFREGRDCVENEPHARRPRAAVTPANIVKIEELIRDNHSQETGVSVGSVENCA